MIYTKDKLLTDCLISNMPFNEFLKDCEKVIKMPEIHSDECSSDDKALAQEERENKKGLSKY